MNLVYLEVKSVWKSQLLPSLAYVQLRTYSFCDCISSHQVIEDFAVPVGIDAFPGRLHVAWHMTRRIGYVSTRQAWNRYTFTLLNILGAVFSGNRLLRRNQNLRFSHIINPLESFERPQFWCYPGTATCEWTICVRARIRLNEMSNSSYSSVFHDFSGVL
ncbi:hypothetical protein T05_1623, partial [Trichinella murrelli]